MTCASCVAFLFLISRLTAKRQPDATSLIMAGNRHVSNPFDDDVSLAFFLILGKKEENE